MAEETAVAPNERTIRLCRLGTYYDEKRKPYHRFIRLEGDALTSTLAFMLNKDNKHITGVGTIWELVEIDQPDGPRWRLSAAKYINLWGNKLDRLTWDTEQELRDAEYNAHTRAQKAGADSPLRAAIQPLRDLYRSQVGSNRAQLLAFIVKEIVR